jgi:hypothetical protein
MQSFLGTLKDRSGDSARAARVLVRIFGVPSRVVLEFGDAISGISRVSGQAARSIG